MKQVRNDKPPQPIWKGGKPFKIRTSIWILLFILFMAFVFPYIMYLIEMK